ncbi:hypothetical protein ACWD4N_03330 [Streptomyces sp. NPDC002586]
MLRHKQRQRRLHRSDAGSQCTSFAFTTHLMETGIDACVGDTLDSALTESQVSLDTDGIVTPRRLW